MMRKFKILKLSNGDTVDFYGAEVGDVVELKENYGQFSGAVWLNGSDVFKEEGWGGLAQYCVADDMETFLEFVEEIV
jgi:hypothetical protein